RIAGRHWGGRTAVERVVRAGRAGRLAALRFFGGRWGHGGVRATAARWLATTAEEHHHSQRGGAGSRGRPSAADHVTITAPVAALPGLSRQLLTIRRVVCTFSSSHSSW